MTMSSGRFDVDTRTPLSAYAKAAMAAIAGIALGLTATYVTTNGDYPFGAATSGPWTAWPKTGAMDVDPYARAIIARQAEVPLGNGEGVVFVARADSAGEPLQGACDYAISGQMPVARLWTLAVYTPKGRLAVADAGPNELTSGNVLRSSSGPIEIMTAASARAGNWIATPKGRPFALALTLYDAAASPTQSSLESLALPAIRKGSCT